MTDRELMHQALEALEGLAGTSWSDAFKQRKYDSDEPEENVQRECVLGAITALRERLAQPEPWEQFYPDMGNPFQPQRTHWEGCEEVHPECRKREWVGLEQSDMPDGEDPIYDDPRFIAGMVWAANKLKEKNAWT